MGFSLREISSADKFSAELTCQALATAIPQSAIEQVLAQTGVPTPRTRKLDLPATVWTTIIMNPVTDVSIDHAFRKLAQGVRYIWPDPEYPLPTPAPSVIAAINSAPAPWPPYSMPVPAPWPPPV